MPDEPTEAPPTPAQQPPAGQPPAAQPGRQADPDGQFTHADGQRRGFPEATPWTEMQPPQQVAYWQNAARKYQRTALPPDQLEDLRRKATEYDALAAASQTDQQRAVAEAETRARAEVTRTYGTRMVDLAIRAQLAGRLPEDQLAGVLGPLDRAYFLTPDGEVDTDRVNAYASSLGPTGAGHSAGGTPPPLHGLGYRPQAAPSGAAEGRAQAARRFGQSQAS